MSNAVASSIADAVKEPGLNINGIGGTLSGNALAVAAVRATLESTLREDDFARMIPLARRSALGVQATTESVGLDWLVSQLGAGRILAVSRTQDCGGGGQRPWMTRLSRCFMCTHSTGVLLTPFHNMTLMCPATSADDVDRHTEVFSEAIEELTRQ